MNLDTNDILAAGSSGVIGGLTALAVWELTAAPEVLAAAAAGVSGVTLHIAYSVGAYLYKVATDGWRE